MEDNSAASLPPGLGNRRADACLLMGHLVELGVPGWKEAKAAMNPPPHALIEAAEPPAGKDNGRNSRQTIFDLMPCVYCIIDGTRETACLGCRLPSRRCIYLNALSFMGRVVCQKLLYPGD